MVRTTNKKIQRAIRFFIKRGIPFTVKTTNQRVELYSKVANYSNKESELPAHELAFIKKVKQFIIKNELYKTVRNRFKSPASKKKIHYFYVAPHREPDTLLGDCVEIDLKSAYWEAAYRMGLLSEDIYQQGKTISKKSRLAAIGSLAKVTRQFEFDGKKQRELDSIRSTETEHLWDEICYRVGKLVMEGAKAAGNGFVFVWVDAMFLEKRALPAVEKVIKQAGYDYSVDPTEWLQINESEIIVKGKGKWVREDGKRIWKDTRKFSLTVKAKTPKSS